MHISSPRLSQTSESSGRRSFPLLTANAISYTTAHSEIFPLQAAYLDLKLDSGRVRISPPLTRLHLDNSNRRSRYCLQQQYRQKQNKIFHKTSNSAPSKLGCRIYYIPGISFLYIYYISPNMQELWNKLGIISFISITIGNGVNYSTDIIVSQPSLVTLFYFVFIFRTFAHSKIHFSRPTQQLGYYCRSLLCEHPLI